jgi:hypothetical protein
MNQDHLDDTLAIVRRHGSQPDAQSARLASLDATGLTIECTDATGAVRTARVPWPQRPTDRGAIRQQLVDLTASARAT